MRQGQQNRRGRGRNNNNNNNNNRKSQNPLTRSFESSGPDVKIRGTPAHIAEKYMALARDAQSSGDPVLAENYLQHAEHYNRIIMAYREQMAPNGEVPNGMGHQRPRPMGPGGEMVDGGDEGEGEESPEPMAGQGSDQGPSPQVRGDREERQHPRHEGRGYESRGEGRHDRYQRHHDQSREHRGDAGQSRFSEQPRHEDQPSRMQGEGGGQRFRDRRPYPPQERPYVEPQPAVPAVEPPVAGNAGGAPPSGSPRPAGPRRRERYGQGGGEQARLEQPDFLRRPVRRRRDSTGDDPGAGPQPDAADAGGGSDQPLDKTRL